MPRTQLIVYVHIPKTAGSMVTDALLKIGPGTGHLEQYRSDPQKIAELVESSAWISGHIPIDRFEALLTDFDRPVRYFSTIREPKAQVMSHYNWLIEIYYRDRDFYEKHPEQVRKISQNIRASNRSDPKALVENLWTYRNLFLNFQSKFILGEDFKWGVDDMQEKLERFEFISNGKDMDEILFRMSRKLKSKKKVNSSKYHFDPDIFDEKIVSDFLQKNNSRDIDLYICICELMENK